MSFDPNNMDPQQMFALFQQFMVMMAANGGQMPMSTAPTPAAPVPQTTFSPSFAPCPSIDEITLLQATLFDNWPGGIKVKNTNRYKMCLEIWAGDADDIRLSQWDSKCSISLMDYYVFSAKFDTLLARGSISNEYHEMLKAIWIGSTNDYWFGLLGNKGDPSGNGPKGTTYYDQQFIRVRFDRVMRPVEFDLIVNGDFLSFADGFVDADMKGNMLRGQAQYQARLDRCNYDASWATAKEVK